MTNKTTAGAGRREIQVDMSPEAVDRRLRDLAQLYRLGLQISTARRLGKVKDLRKPA